MPVVHLPKRVNDRIDDLLVRLITEGQIKIKRSTVIELAFDKGFDNVTLEAAIAFENKE